MAFGVATQLGYYDPANVMGLRNSLLSVYCATQRAHPQFHRKTALATAVVENGASTSGGSCRNNFVEANGTATGPLKSMLLDAI